MAIQIISDAGRNPALTYLAILLSIVSLLTPASTLATDIYKWVDKDGKVHYGDHPPSGEPVEKVQIKERTSQDPAYGERLLKQNRLLEIYDEERQEKKSIQAAQEAEEEKRRANCAKARKQLQEVQDANYLYEETGDPDNPRILNTEERMQATAQVKARVEKWCK